MSDAENRICLVCEEELEPNSDGVIVVKNLNWHENCLGYIPSEEHFDKVRQSDGHAVMDRHQHEVDMTVLLRRQQKATGESGK